MVDKLKAIPAKIMEWWNKFTSKQKTIIICGSAGVVFAFAILITVLTRPQYELLATCESTKEASVVKELLDGEKLTYKVSDDGLVITILKSQLSDANLLLGANDIPVAAYDMENVFKGGFSTTEADKQKRYKLYCEGQLEEDLMAYSFVQSASVQISVPEDDGTLIKEEEESFASIILGIDGEMPEDAATSIARIVATALGNKTMNNITIVDTNGKLLYAGEDNYSVSGGASNQLTVKQQAENMVKNEVKKVLLGTNEFDNVEVASNLKLDFSSKENTTHAYSAPEGTDQGLYSHKDTYQSDSTGGNAGIPGTTSNTETTYVMENNTQNSDSVSEISEDFLQDESITSTTTPGGVIVYDQSSLSVAAIKYKILKEEDAKSQGLLEGITWDEYKAANSARTKLTTDKDFVTLVAKATGIGEADISIVAYEEPMYVDAAGGKIKVTDILQIVLIVIILALLAFVVLRSMKGEKPVEEEEELSVETLLQSTPEVALEDIGAEAKSQERQMVEKFVEENPEAAANLLRNWLNEDWG
ncbi:MAG: flagellar M-ring protein FliF C-terminal domain-containing protein [Lachnospiraceae bacterium]